MPSVTCKHYQSFLTIFLALCLLGLAPEVCQSQSDSTLVSKLETYNIKTGERKMVYRIER